MNRKRKSAALCAFIENSACSARIQKLIEDGADVNFQSDEWDNDTPLLLAVTAGDADIVRLLIEHGANTSLKNYEGKSALDMALEGENEEIRKLFCSEPNQISSNNSSFHQSIKNGNLEEVEIFVRLNPHLKTVFDSKNNTALKTAYECKQYEIIAFLSSEGFTFGPQEDSQKIAGESFEMSKLRQAYLRYFPKPDDSHILQLMIFSRLNFNPNDPKNHFLQIREYFEELDKMDECKQILKIVANYNLVDIVFDFENASVIEIDPTTRQTTAGNVYPFAICKHIYIAAGRSREDILGTLIHELCHLAMDLVYENRSKPFKTNDINREKSFKAILSKYEEAVGKTEKLSN